MLVHRSDAGFTLIELLVVIVIIGLLGTLGLTFINSARQDSDELVAEAFIATVGATLDLYKNDRRIGVYPPSSLENFTNLGRLANRYNLGNEALVACLNSPGFKGDRVLDDFQDQLDNVDDDRSAKPLTIYATNELFEILDPWGNPYAYFNSADYGNPNVRQYSWHEDFAGDYEVVTVKPWVSPKTKSPFNLDSYQLFSAGPDLKFNTEDDIGNW